MKPKLATGYENNPRELAETITRFTALAGNRPEISPKAKPGYAATF